MVGRGGAGRGVEWEGKVSLQSPRGASPSTPAPNNWGHFSVTPAMKWEVAGTFLSAPPSSAPLSS